MESTDVKAGGLKLLANFIQAAASDGRIGTAHICIYVSLLAFLHERGEDNCIYVFSQEVLRHAKIASVTTYYKIVRELQDYGYIRYIPSYNHFLGSLVYFLTPG